MRQGIMQVVDAINSGHVVDYQLPQHSNAKYLSVEADERRQTSLDWAQDFMQDTSAAQPAAPLS